MLPGRAKLVKQPSEALEMEGKKVKAIFDNQEAPIFVRNFVLLLFVAHHCLCCCQGLSSPLLQLCNYLCAVSRIIEEFRLAGTWIFSSRLGCSELPPAWPWMCPGTEYLSPLWPTCLQRFIAHHKRWITLIFLISTLSLPSFSFKLLPLVHLNRPY